MTETPKSLAIEGPLHAVQERHGATFLNYGPTQETGGGVPVVETFGEYEAEYAMIRKGVGIIDAPQRGLVEVRGADRAAFLHRMLTNDTRTLSPGEGRRAFLLGKTGRIMADTIILHDEQRTLLELDLSEAATLPGELEKYIFTEDVQLADKSGEFHHLALHGPAGASLLDSVGGTGAAGLEVLQHRAITLAGQGCVVYRYDDTGSLGLHLIVPRQGAIQIYEALAAAVGGLTPVVEGGVIRPIRGRGIGWAAYNTARIEAGTPLFHIDFGPDSLPHETGILKETVSFTKGCYLGQEIVARMQNLGHPKRVLVGLRFGDGRMPIAGAQMMEAGGGISDFGFRISDLAEGSPGASKSIELSKSSEIVQPPSPTNPKSEIRNPKSPPSTGKIIGAVTSSTLSPLLGGVAIALAIAKWGAHQAGTVVAVPAEGEIVGAKVQALSFL